MHNPEVLTDKFSEALPAEFSFYHLGEVEIQHGEAVKDFGNDTIQGPQTRIGFKIMGDLSAFVVVSFSRELEISTYTELGNILVSRLATQLSKNNQIETMISPPQVLTEDQVKQMAANRSNVIRRCYSHVYENKIIPVEALVIPYLSEGVGYA